MPKNLNNKVVRGVEAVTKSLSVVSSFLLCAMVLVIVLNIGGRFLFRMPLYGTIELVELMMIIISFFAMAYTSMQQRHVRITFLLDHLPRKVQQILGSIVAILSVGIFSFIFYQATINSVYYLNHLDQRTDTLEIPIAPFKIVMVLGIGLLLCIEFIHVFFPLAEPDVEE